MMVRIDRTCTGQSLGEQMLSKKLGMLSLDKLHNLKTSISHLEQSKNLLLLLKFPCLKSTSLLQPRIGKILIDKAKHQIKIFKHQALFDDKNCSLRSGRIIVKNLNIFLIYKLK